MGLHGRELSACALVGVVLTSTALTAQAQGRFQELLPDLAGKIAASLAGAPASLSGDSAGADDARSIETAVVEGLTARGIRIVPRAADVADVRVACRDNLRERVCTADIRKGAAPLEIAVVTRPLAGDIVPGRRGSMAIELQPLFSQRTPILDLVRVDDRRMVVLDATAIGLYESTERRWELRQSRPLPVSRPWPRDLRGRLRVDDDRFEAFLPGMTCTGRLDEAPVTCTQGATAWPLGIENSGLQPGTNMFTTPTGQAFFAAAPLGPDADARWVVADRAGALVWLDAAQRSSGIAGRGDDVASLQSCGSDTRLLVASRADGRDSLRAFQASRGRLVPITPSIPVSGTLTALWPMPGASSAIAVVHDATAGHDEAYLASLPCVP